MKRTPKKSELDWRAILMSGLLIGAIVASPFVLLYFAASLPLTPSSATTFQKYQVVPDVNDTVLNRQHCWDAMDAYLKEWNSNHAHQLRWTGQLYVTCDHGRCICE